MIQQRERVFDLADRLVGDTIDAACPPDTHSDDWNFDQLQAQLAEQFNAKIGVNRKLQDTGELAAASWAEVEALLSRREEELGTKFFLYFARHFWLEEIDSNWIEHLKSMDHLREGIGLRGYGQKDPKQEYKKEGFTLFGEMMDAISKNTAAKLFRVQIRREEPVPEFKHKQRKMVAVPPGDAGAGAGAGEAAGSSAYGKAADGGAPHKQQTVRRAEPKVGRNDPCPCGSGKKYKKCHGATDRPAP